MIIITRYYNATEKLIPNTRSENNIYTITHDDNTISSFRLCMWLLYQCVNYATEVLASNLSSSGALSHWLALYQVKNGKRLAHDVVILYPSATNADLFMTSHTHTARRKISVLTAMFWRLPNVDV